LANESPVPSYDSTEVKSKIVI